MHLKGRQSAIVCYFFDNGSEYESECRPAWVDVWVDTSVGVRKRQPEINSADLQLVNYCSDKNQFKGTVLYLALYSSVRQTKATHRNI